VNQWTFFQNIYTNLITPNLAAMQAMVTQVSATMMPIAAVMAVIWIAFMGADMAIGSKSGQQVVKEFGIMALFLGLLPMAQYNTYVSGFILNGVPNTFNAAMGATGTPMAALDNELQQAVTAASKTYEALPGNPLKFIPLGLAIIVFVGSAAITVCYAFGVYMVAALINVAAVVVGPVFIALAAFPISRRLATGWFGVLVGGCVTQLMAMTVITLLAKGEAIMINGVVVTAKASNSNSVMMLWGLAQVAMLFYLAKLVVQAIPDIARAIGGGVHSAAAAGIHAVTIGAVEKTAKEAAAIAATAAAGAAVGAATGGGMSGGASGAGRAVMARTFPSVMRSAAAAGPSKSGGGGISDL
jgi:type IV secretory pathway VirB6-like protein